MSWERDERHLRHTRQPGDTRAGIIVYTTDIEAERPQPHGKAQGRKHYFLLPVWASSDTAVMARLRLAQAIAPKTA